MTIQEELSQQMPTSNGQLHTKFILQGKECFPLEFFAGVGTGLCPHDREHCKQLLHTPQHQGQASSAHAFKKKKELFVHLIVLPTYMCVNHACTLPMEVRRCIPWKWSYM